MKNKLIISGVLILQIAVSGVAWAQSANVVTKQYDDGGIYEGTFKNGLQDGKGTYKGKGKQQGGCYICGHPKHFAANCDSAEARAKGLGKFAAFAHHGNKGKGKGKPSKKGLYSKTSQEKRQVFR